MKAQCILGNVRLIKQSLRARQGYAIGVIGKAQAIEERLLSFVNFGLVASARHAKHPHDGLHLGKPAHFQYIICQESRFIEYAKWLYSLQFDVERIDLGLPSMDTYLERKARALWDSIAEIQFLDIPSGEPYAMTSEFCQTAKREIRELREHPEREESMTSAR